MELTKSELGIIFDSLTRALDAHEIDGEKDDRYTAVYSVWKRIREELFFNRLTPHQPDAAITPAGGGSESAAAQVI